MEDNQRIELKCTRCQRTLDLGIDVVSVEEGVIGPRGIVPLKEPSLFCGEDCVAGHFGDDTQVERLPRRVP